jgi:hypothetical protein
MRLQIALFAAAAAALTAGAAHAASVDIKDAVARVTLVPENRTDIKVEIVHANPQLPIQVRSLAGRTIVDGDLDRKIHNCRGRGGSPTVQVRGVGDVRWEEMPQIVIRTPRNVDVDAGGAVFGSVGRSATLELSNSGCGDWKVGNVDGHMRISQHGSGDTRTGSAGSAKVRIAGSGDVATAEIRGGLEVDIAGSGDVAVASVSGPLQVSIAGSGDVKVGGGRATLMTASVAGSGDISFEGTADQLKARVMGSGDIRAREVRGEVTKMVMGSGDISIGR